jgi:hypothetical protein
VSVPSSTGGEVCMRTDWFQPVFIREKVVRRKAVRANQKWGRGGGNGSQVGL